MVLLVMGILCMVGMPRLQSALTQIRLDAAAQELFSSLTYAQNLAVRYQRPFGVRADTGANWYRVFDNRYKSDSSPHHGDDPPAGAYGVVLNPVDKKWYQRDFDEMEEYQGVRIQSVPAGSEVCFHPDGHSSSADSSFALVCGGEQRTISVTGTTGAIQIQ